MTQAHFGQGATGPNPIDRAKAGTKRSLLTDGAGIPLALVVDGANRHDCKLLGATVDGTVIARPQPSREYPQHLCLDADYDSPLMRLLVRARGYLDHIRSRGQEREERKVRFLLRQCTSLRHPFVS
jgi:putative transposase